MRSFVAIVSVVLLTACGGDGGGDVEPSPCGGLCPADQCFAGTCIGGNNGEDDAGDGGTDADVADADVPDPDTPDGEDVADTRDTPDVPEDSGDTGDADVPFVCDDDDDCGDGEVCEDGACVAGCIEDGFEPNDDADADPVDLNAGSSVDLEELTVCRDDADWFPVEIDEVDEQLSVTAVQGAASPGLIVEILATDAATVLDAADTDDGERRSAAAVAATPGTYFVRVTAPEGLEARGLNYTLTITRTEPDGCVPDGFEPNETADAAAALSLGNQEARLCRSDEDTDWFRFDVALGDEVDLTLAYDHAAVAPNDDLGSLVFGPGGEDDLRDFLLRDGDSDTDRLASGPFTAGRADEGTWRLQIATLGDGEPVDYTVSLDVESVAMSCGVEDPSEPNDDCASAAPLPTFASVDGYFCGPESDDDWFSVEVAAGEELYVSVEHFHFEGNLELEVFDPDDGLVGLSYNAGPDLEEVTIEDTQAGTYCVRVYARSTLTENAYTVAAELR